MKNKHMIIDDKTGKTSGPFTDNELVERYSEQPPATDTNAHNTALERHDAEVRKPLVELLRGVHTWFMQQSPRHYNGCGLWIDVDATLAEHPRDNCILDVDSPTAIHDREEYLQCGCANCRRQLALADAKTDRAPDIQ